ncbi:bis(5'-nucleosyl)-tetraphosphatase (symmetrical) YqeK [Selenihalanaerobacter shriftii]|uniref:bis(5'-nucleosyl)-tetraphosphatase (symmetrical) n=1 Tax=Selenihalanaerobacter shriftii TaxID=142842 RepID=A0A1T4PPL6_9FIRM|nr:bis(5'-nucleosyl)-tetraphosphatase (symmetrical) YqeK [Selenihalanaerobacter shriftii]SJZ93369.1 putative HD superfamily hydrolase of NAD metabolism [Selenihalanaerobacter shriftii]
MMLEKEMLKLLKQMISEDRLNHSLGVRDTAIELAKIYEIDLKKARIAGLLHDCAKGLSNNNLLKKAEKFGIVIDGVTIIVPPLLHGPVGAEFAKRKFKINDEEILNAIRIHTLGSEEMTSLEKIIFLADYIEPNRKCSGLDKLRKIARSNLDLAVRKACDRTLKFHLDNHDVIHPQTLATRNAFLRKGG